jgi:hypothetical protein
VVIVATDTITTTVMLPLLLQLLLLLLLLSLLQPRSLRKHQQLLPLLPLLLHYCYNAANNDPTAG